jgi:hypothetical protein
VEEGISKVFKRRLHDLRHQVRIRVVSKLVLPELNNLGLQGSDIGLRDTGAEQAELRRMLVVEICNAQSTHFQQLVVRGSWHFLQLGTNNHGIICSTTGFSTRTDQNQFQNLPTGQFCEGNLHLATKYLSIDVFIYILSVGASKDCTTSYCNLRDQWQLITMVRRISHSFFFTYMGNNRARKHPGNKSITDGGNYLIVRAVQRPHDFFVLLGGLSPPC